MIIRCTPVIKSQHCHGDSMTKTTNAACQPPTHQLQSDGDWFDSHFDEPSFKTVISLRHQIHKCWLWGRLCPSMFSASRESDVLGHVGTSTSCERCRAPETTLWLALDQCRHQHVGALHTWRHRCKMRSSPHLKNITKITYMQFTETALKSNQNTFICP